MLPKPHCGRRNGLIPACEKNAQLVLDMALRGESLAAIARVIGGKGLTIHRWLKKQGLTLDFPKNRMGEKSGRWKGGRRTTPTGYVEVLMKDHPDAHRYTGYILEHRLVMERMIGRRLLRGEVVHHKDGNKLNNAPENLQLFAKNSDHLKAELTGRVPKWTEDGKRRIREAHRRPGSQKQTGIPAATAPGDQGLQ